MITFILKQISKLLNNSKYTYLLDPGHGGIIDGIYQTDGNRSPNFDDNTVLYEGVYNRKVIDKISNKLNKKLINNINIVDTQKDMPLSDRTDMANGIHEKLKNTIYISIHGNAYGESWNGANGVDSFYFKKGDKYSVKGKKLATEAQKFLVEYTDRKDRGVKGRNYHVLRETSMPSVLLETGFMTNKEEASLMLTDEYQEKVANAVVQFIKKIEKGYVI